jgi:hypothetical protein
MKTGSGYYEVYAVIEKLPWVFEPRILFYAETEKEASMEVSRLNGAPDSQSTFYVAKVVVSNHISYPPKYVGKIIIGTY